MQTCQQIEAQMREEARANYLQQQQQQQQQSNASQLFLQMDDALLRQHDQIVGNTDYEMLNYVRAIDSALRICGGLERVVENNAGDVHVHIGAHEINISVPTACVARFSRYALVNHILHNFIYEGKADI